MVSTALQGLKNDIIIAKHFLALVTKISKLYTAYITLYAIVNCFDTFLIIMAPKFIIDELLGEQRLTVILTIIAAIIGLKFFLVCIKDFLDSKINVENLRIKEGFNLHIGNIIMDMPIENIEDPKILTLKKKAMFPIHDQDAIKRMLDGLFRILQQFIVLITIAGLLSILNPLLMLALLVIVLLNVRLLKNNQKNLYDFNSALAEFDKKFDYYQNTTTDYSFGKDVRLYDASNLVIGKIHSCVKSSIAAFFKLDRIQGRNNGLINVNLQIQTLIVYLYLAYKVVTKSISIADFTMYMNAANKFSSGLSDILSSYNEIRQMCRYLENYMKLESIPAQKCSESSSLDMKREPVIEVRNVWFKYPRSHDYILKNISITMNPGEKISIVGLNGAGKTTFIKLLLGFYEPSKGEIYVAGKPIKEYNFEEYVRLFSVVFQDSKLFSFSIKENLLLNDHYHAGSNQVVGDILKRVSMYDYVNSLNNGADSLMFKMLDDGGVEFSGGQNQKLVVGRALHKNASILILDEATSALDPVSEKEIDDIIDANTQDKLVIFISHKLSSCQKADKVLFFQDGEIAESGNHKELMELNREYAALYRLQMENYIA
ncbi:ABC transporter ATP-binding protein [Paenibacillus motobuensis]|uniref:ABC transporter ATP-binding protein n=1 Tax=Paenibacillus motobuensis TaxID=295324 RepID=A0ABN0XXB5_9BACL